jgi:hypothetical protein
MEKYKLVVFNIISLTLGISAAFLLYNDKSGWVWFLLCSILCFTTPTSE